MCSLTRAIALFVFCGFGAGAWATPSVSKVSGDLAQGQTLTISGSGFSVANAVPVVWDTVDNQSAYKGLADGTVVPTDKGPWTENGGSVYRIPVTIAKSGDLRDSNSSAVYAGANNSFLGWPRAMSGLGNKAIFVSWWFKPSEPITNGGSDKIIRIWDDNNGYGTRLSWTQMHMTIIDETTNYTPHPDWADWGGVGSQWNHEEIWADANTGVVKAWTNGKLIHSVTDFQKANISQGLTVGLVGFDPSILGLYPNMSFRMTDIYVSTSQARVEISSNPEWNGPGTNTEIQVPTLWSDSQIKISLNVGNLNDLQKCYLYVIDKNGNVNQKGYPLDGKLPSPPVLKVK